MGYRSEVAITLYTKDYKTMVKRANTLKDKSIYEFIKEADRFIADENNITTLYWDYIKWYNDDKIIKWIEKFIRNVDSTFIRIGEDNDDNEEKYYNKGYDLLEYAYYIRVIEIQGTKYKKEEDII